MNIEKRVNTFDVAMNNKQRKLMGKVFNIGSISSFIKSHDGFFEQGDISTSEFKELFLNWGLLSGRKTGKDITTLEMSCRMQLLTCTFINPEKMCDYFKTISLSENDVSYLKSLHDKITSQINVACL